MAETTPTTIHTIKTHVCPHPDEIAAVWGLQEFGKDLFPGIEKAKLEFVDAGSMPPDGKTAQDMEREGVLAVGVWRGRFDEHPGDVEGRKEKESACSLVFKALGIDQEPACAYILEYVNRDDLEGAKSAWELGPMVKSMHSLYPKNPEWVIEWCNAALDAKYREQKRFHGLVRKEYEERAQMTEVAGYDDERKTRIVAIATDLHEMLGFARSRMAKHGPADVVILINSRGQVLVSVDRRMHPRVYTDLIVMIRGEEARLKGMQTPRWSDLAGGGTAPGVPEWFSQENMRLLLNGGRSSPGTPATRISLEQILEFACIAANPNEFAPERVETCRAGTCVASRETPCSWYDHGLTRCRVLRGQQNTAREAESASSLLRPRVQRR